MQNTPDKNNSQQLRNVIIEAALNFKGKDITDIDLTKVGTTIARHFVICHADSRVQVKSIAKEIEDQIIKQLNIKPVHKEGIQNSCWILLDYFDVIVHVFLNDCRYFYRLEELWADGTITKYEHEAITVKHK